MREFKLPELVVVEDSIDDEWMSMKGIVRSGVACHVTVKRNDADLIHYLREEENPVPDLVLLDFDLPGHKGLDVLKTLRSDTRTQWVPVVVFSEDASNEVATDCYRNGANSLVKKPPTPDVYYNDIARLIRFWLTAQE